MEACHLHGSSWHCPVASAFSKTAVACCLQELIKEYSFLLSQAGPDDDLSGSKKYLYLTSSSDGLPQVFLPSGLIGFCTLEGFRPRHDTTTTSDHPNWAG